MIELDKYYDVIIVGAGVAGLNCALNLPRDRKILIICKDTPDKSDSYLAQGGICRLVDEDDYQGYFEDTMRAGHYENNPATVDCMIRNSQELIDDLIACGVRFAKNADGLAGIHEGGRTFPSAHLLPRGLHGQGDYHPPYAEGARAQQHIHRALRYYG